jgi:hypothetical protein
MTDDIDIANTDLWKYEDDTTATEIIDKQDPECGK